MGGRARTPTQNVGVRALPPFPLITQLPVSDSATPWRFPLVHAEAGIKSHCTHIANPKFVPRYVPN